MAKISGYNKFCNDDGKGNFNTHTTASGIPISNQQYTLAVPMNGVGEKDYKVGDVIAVKNNATGATAIYLATDVGGLPHADVDIVEGVGLKALGVDVTKGGESAGKGVQAVSQKEGFTVNRIGALDIRNGSDVRKFQDLSHAINKGEAELGQLASIGTFKTGLSEEQKKQTLASYAPNISVDDFPARGDRGYRERKTNPDGSYAESYRDDDQYIGYLSKLMQSNPILAIFLLVIGLMTGQISQEQLTDVLKGMLTGEGQNAGYGQGATNVGDMGVDHARYNNKGVLGGRVQGLTEADGRTLELPRYDPAVHKTAGEYFAACAKKFEGMREGANNSGNLVKWVMANAGLSEGNPWCAGFSSKMYEGTGLYNYTASALNFGEQGTATGSYRQGTINGIEVGDTVVYDRGTTTDYQGHVGIVVAVGTKNGETAITTIEGNSGQMVATHTRTLSELKANRFMGFVDISHREEQLLAKGQLAKPITATLAEKYAVGQTNQPEYTPPAPQKTAGTSQSQGPPGQASTTQGATKQGLTIVLDRGHGALQPTLDTGAVSPNGSKGKINEIQLANIYQAELKAALEQKGYKVALTSDVIDDHSKKYATADESRYARTEIAKRAVGSDNGLYLSIHANSTDKSDQWQEGAKGAEMFYAGHVAGSQEFASSIASSVRSGGGTEVTKVKNYGRGSERNNGEGLRQFEKATFPSALIEMGYLNNREDYQYLSDESRIRQQARSVAEGIDKYAKAKGLYKEQEVIDKAAAEKAAADKAAAEKAAADKAAAEKAAADKAAADKAAAEKAAAEKAAEEAKKNASSNLDDDAKAKALKAVAGISPENKITDTTKPTADKDPAETLAMHNATIAAVNKESQKTPPAANVVTDQAKTTGAALA